MRAALFAPLKDGDAAMGAMVETAVFSQWFHSDLMRDIHYARWKKGRQTLEVDLVRIDPATLTPVQAWEIKWSDRYANTDQTRNLTGLLAFAERNADRGISIGMMTKTTTAKSSSNSVQITQTPCSLQCYQIGKDVVAG